MGSRLDDQASRDYPGAFAEATETVIRRIGGREDRTENVEAIVDFDVKRAADLGGLFDNERGQYIDFGGLLEIAEDQVNTKNDTWVIGESVYPQIGEAIGKDGGSKTVVLLKRTGSRGRESRVTGSRR